MVPLLILITLGVYALVLLIPGDPSRTLAGGLNAQPAEIARIRGQLHLNEPFFAQYWRWVTHAARGDLGTSLFQHESVSSAIRSRFPLTLSLALGGLVVSLLIGLPIGIHFGPTTAFVFLATILTGVMIAIYMIFNLSCMLFYLRRQRSEFNILLHAVIPVLGIAFLGYTIYKNVTGQVFPYDRFPFVVLAWLIVGTLIVVATPRLAARIGEGLARDEGLEMPGSSPPGP